MQKHGNVWTYSPSDLIQFLENEAVTWFNRFEIEQPGVLSRDEQAASENLIQLAGDEHERRFLEELLAEKRDVADLRGVSDGGARTLEAMRSGREVIYQGRLEAGEFAGYADFLMRVDGNSDLGRYHYEVWDTKLARGLKPYFAIQLSCYAELLEAVQGRLPEYLGLVLGSGSQERLRTDNYFFYYKAIKRAFLEQQHTFDPDRAPRLCGTADYRHWGDHITRLLEQRDDLSFVANIRESQVDKLQAAGIATMTQLATLRANVATIQTGTLDRLRTQARLQLASRSNVTPRFEIVAHDPERPRLGFGGLPPRSKNDVCFDIEGYPLIEGGIEYLFGAVYQDGLAIRFRDWWAHNREQERSSLEQFIQWAHARWREDPSMHIYHYASYEVTALKRLMCRHGCCEAEVDDLLRNGVFVDLFTVVRQSLVIGEPAYSLKNVEHLYRPQRVAGVVTAGDSMVQYHRWLEHKDGDDWQSSAILTDLRNYNEEDCRSTWDLIGWLRGVQSTSGISFVLPSTEPKKPGEVTTDRAALAEHMLSEIPAETRVDAERWRVHELLAHLLEFHRREHKPSWWFLFERAGMTEQELIEDPDCLGGLERTNTPPGVTASKRSLRYEFRFDPGQESKLRDGDKCRFAHDIDCKVEIENIDYVSGLLCFTLGKNRPAPSSRLSLIPDDIFSAGVIVDSIERTTRTYCTNHELPSALHDFLFRRAPNIAGHKGGALVLPGVEVLQSARDLVGQMNNTTLFIQGPPGCGKTFTGGDLIAHLLSAGKRVGVTSNSHRAICLLLKSAAEAADRLGVKFTGAKAGCDETQETVHPRIDLLAENGDVFKLPALPDLVGGTAWVFARPEAIGEFDYLFVDEAGQVCVANLVGMAPSADNLVLIGDQMQLNQPIQGTHPGESGQSVLEYLLGDVPTVAEDRGILLPDTWRMRPEVCEFVSDAIYEGRIHAHPITSERHIVFGNGVRHWVKCDSGLIFIPVVHEGNTYDCPQEIEVINAVVQELCGHFIELPGQTTRGISSRDFLIVAPFNLQVRRLQAAQPSIRVGTVDKFQGQEAPIVIFSMTSSDGDASPRGIEFLFSRNRLNVAISRAQVLAIILGSPKLERTMCAHLEQMQLVNLFCRAVEAGNAAPGGLVQNDEDEVVLNA
jgi:predicted RecB family nuclease